MANLFLKLSDAWNSFRKPLILILLVIILFLFGIYLFSQTRITGDTASHLLLAISPILEIGSPYKDFWEIKPPVWPLVLYLWSSFFGFGILSIKLINMIMAVLVVLMVRVIYKKVLPTPIFEIIFCFTIIIVLSPLLNSMIMPTEILGLVLSIGALLILMSIRKDFSRFYFSGFLFFAASQAKEPFALTVLAAFPVFLDILLHGDSRRLIKNLTQFLLGIITCAAAIYIYLSSFGSAGSYIEIFKYKQVFFPFTLDRLSQNLLPGFHTAQRTFIEFSRGFSILIFLAMLSFYLVNKFRKTLSFNLHSSRLTTKPIVVMDPDKLKISMVFFYALGSFLSFGLGGSFGSHYLIQVVIPFYIMGGLIVSYSFHNALFLFKKSKLYFYIALLLLGFSLVILIPKRPYFSSFLPENINFVTEDGVLGFERRITEITTKDQCVLSVYGWGVSENYLYSLRKPCTRFFLANIVNQDWQKKEYARDIIKNPPAAIVYQIVAADMDIRKFESEVININKIVKNCYVQDVVESVVYVPKIKNVESLRNCIRDNSV